MSLEIVKFDYIYEHLLAAVTGILHDSYKVLVDAGMKATVHQNSETTLKRLE